MLHYNARVTCAASFELVSTNQNPILTLAILQNVIKQLVYASACVCRDVGHAGSLESTQETRVARAALLRLFRALQTSRVLNRAMYTR